MKLFLTNLQLHWFSTRYGEGLDKGFFMSYICKRENTENTKPMDFKKIACTAIRRWNEKRHTDKTAGTRRTTLPETQKPQPAQGVPTAQPAPAAHHLLHRHVLVQSAFRPFGKPQVHLRTRGASHQYIYIMETGTECWNHNTEKTLFQHHAFGFHMLTKENGSRLHKFVRTFRGQEAARAALRTQRFYFRMTLQVIFQAVGHVFSLGDDTHITRSVFQNLVQQQIGRAHV